MKKIFTILLSLFFVTLSFGQRKYAADRYFKEYAYTKAAELYEKIYDNGDDSKLVLSRLGDTYYFNSNTEKAEIWYRKLVSQYENDIEPEYLFKYAQTLKSNGKYNESDQWLLKFKALKEDDTRGEELLSKSNYLQEYTNIKKVFINIHNLSINTEYSDFGAFIHNDSIYFASTRPDNTIGRNKLYKWNKQPFLNLYQGLEKTISINENNTYDIEESKRIEAPINTRYHEATASITKDGKTMYFTRDNYNGRKLGKDKTRTTHLKLYRATRENNSTSWSNIEELPFNNDNYSIGHPALSLNEKELYFVSDMPGSFGYTDIYKVEILGDNSYGAPENLGKLINTEGREMFPFIDAHNVLYFSSDGHLGLGALDIFESQITDNTFGEVKNIGAPINSQLDDFAYMANETRGYFSSNRRGGKGDDDIYSFAFYSCKEDIAGIVTDATTGAPISEATVRLIDEEGKVIHRLETDASGSYKFTDIDCERNFTVVGEKSDYKSDQKEVATLAINGETIEKNLELTPLIIGDQIVINPIYFDFDKYNIREDAEYELEHIVSVMNNHPEMVIKLESHTDSRGSFEYNETLSDNRAKSTRDYILSRGIAPERIESAIGYGEYQLLNHCNDANASNCSKEEHQLNRRSYFYIVKGGDNIRSSNE